MTAVPLRAPSTDAGTDHLAIVYGLLETRDLASKVMVGGAASVVDKLQRGVSARLIILDLVEPASAVNEMSWVRSATPPGTEILALGAVNDVHMFRSLLAAGASDYVPVPATAELLSVAIDRLLASGGGGPVAHSGRVVAVVGTRGGVGSTTVATTLSWLLAEEMSKQTALLDLDLHFGTVALALDIDPGRGLRDALEKPERIDGLYIERAMVKVGANLFALSGEEALDDEPRYDPAAVGVLLGELKRKLDWIVIDLPRSGGPLTRTVLSAATHLIIIADSTLAGLRDTMRLQALALSCNTDQKIFIVRGGVQIGQGGVSRAEFEKELGRPIDGAIPSDPKGANAAANAGQPLPKVAAASPAAVAVRLLTVKLAGAERAARKPKFWQLFGRA